MSHPLVISPVRALLGVVWGAVALSIVAAPYLATHASPGLAALIYLVYSPVCHQIPGRSFTLMGVCWAVCQRCSGIYLGLFAGCLLPAIDPAGSSLPRKLVLTASAPLALDALLPLIGIWENTAASRFASGLLFGAMLSMLLLAGITELLDDCIKRRDPARFSSTKGVHT